MSRSKNLFEQFEYVQKVREINQEISFKKSRQLTYDIRVFGCQMNEHDAEKLKGMLEDMGYVQERSSRNADVVIFVTCCVRENAEEKVYGHLGILKQYSKDMILAVAGCMVQQPHVVEKIKRSYHHVRIVFGTHNLHMFPKYLYSYLTTSKRVFEVWEDGKEVATVLPVKRTSKVKAWVNIMSGCNNFCSYCIVPYTRGREKSREIDDILLEVEGLADKGYKEITLLGQNVNSFGNDRGEKNAFPKLLKKLNDIKGIERIRFMTSHPKDLSDELIESIHDLEKVCKHLHLPFQSGSSRILKLMNRNYTKKQYLKLVDKIKDKVPGIALSTDVIVGFPGETEEDFLDTLDVIKGVEFESAFMFIYSKRSGTVAANMSGQIDEKVKKERFQRLLKLQTDVADRLSKKYENRIFKVLVEGASKNDLNIYTGRTDTNKVVNFKAKEDLTGNLVDVYIVRAGAFWLEGELK